MLEKIVYFRNRYFSWRVISLVIFLFLVIGVPFTVFLAQRSQDIRQKAAEKKGLLPQSQEEKTKYVAGEVIIKLKPQAQQLKTKKEEMQKGVDIETQALPFSALDQETVPDAIKSFNDKYQIKKVDKVFKDRPLNVQANKQQLSQIDISRTYRLSFDEDTPVEAVVKELSQDPEVEYAEPNFIMSTQVLPNDPFFPKMWGLSKIQAENAWTGSTGSAQIKVAVIDTGIDFTHQELGETTVPEERSFTKITEDPLRLLISSTTRVSQTIVLDQNRLAYYSDRTIYIYSFDTGTTETINLPDSAPDPKILRMVLKNNILAYIADYDHENYYSKYKLYLYDLTTHEHKEINKGPTSSSSSLPFEIGDGKIIWAEGAHVAIYDFQTGETSLQTNVNSWPSFQYISFLKASGNIVAYSLHNQETTCYQAIVIHNTITDQRQKYYPPNIGPVLDFKDNKVLYRACYPDAGYNRLAFYLFDTNTNQAQELSYGSVNGTTTGEAKASAFITFVYSWIDEGSLENDVVFLSKAIGGDGIIAFDKNKNRYIEINLLKYANNFVSEGNRVCFVSGDSRIYCHLYDTNYNYPTPPASYFNNKVVGGYNFAENDNNPIDRYGHGTHVAGTIGASVNNSLGISGINWDVSLMAVKVLGNNGSGSTANIVNGIKYAADNGAKVINMSLGGEYKCIDSQIFQDAINYARSKKVTVVVAAGNSNMDASNFSPASCQGVIAVGATGPNDTRALYSNYGSVVDIAAPGGDQGGSACSETTCIHSTFPENRYAFLQGTSMAAPHVAGVAALLLAQNPNLTPDQIESTIKNSGDTITTDRPIGKRLNAYNAVFSLLPSSTPTLTLTPTQTPTPSLTPTTTPTPTLLPSSSNYRRVFVTSVDFGGGDLGGLTGADAKCQQRADAAELGGAWKAWLSDTTTSAEQRLNHSTLPYKRLDGLTIANNWSDLTDGILQNAIKVDEFGIQRLAVVATATKADGTLISTNLTCSNWTSKSSSSTLTIGYSNGTSYIWTANGATTCNSSNLRLYCFEEPAPTPTPAPFVCNACSADANKDGRVSTIDYSLMVTCFDKEATDRCISADINKNGVTDIEDFGCVINMFGQTCSQ